MKTEVVLEKLKFVVMERISKEFLDTTVDFSLHASYLSDDIYMRMKAFVWAEEESIQHHEIKYPSDWWEAFKERWFTKLMLKKWPIKYKYKIIDVKAIYPTLKMKVPKHSPKLVIQTFDGIPGYA